jgi:ribosomal protein S12 methylthiotransferase accessory factor
MANMQADRPSNGRLVRIKPYKAAAPEDTVRAIQFLLGSMGLPFTEEAIHAEEGRFSYCLRLLDDVRGEPVFQTMGKGRTNTYARASAYGEMVERLQNLAFYMTLMYPSEPETGNPTLDMPFKYFPDEKPVAGEELRRGIGRLSRHDNLLEDCLGESAIGVPFWNVFDGHVEYMPFRAIQVIVGSNGMCSGNTPAEALIHGICEVFERHVLKQLFLSPCTPPNVPLDLFAGHDIHDDLTLLIEENGYEVSIKDCSLGARLPVLGLLIRDQQNQYAFHLGADPSPVTALERCLTEMCQGGDMIFQDANELVGVSGCVRVSEFWQTQLHLNIRAYEGHWPPNVLQRELDDPFPGFEHPVSVSDEHDLQFVLGIVRDAGWELLVRDNSFLGFPSFHVYIPGISEMTNAVTDGFAKQFLAFDRHLQLVTNPAGATLVQRQEGVQAMEQYAAAAPARRFHAADYLMHYRQHPMAGMSQAGLQRFLLQPAPLEATLDVPACFECGACNHAGRCNYAFISAVCKRLRRAMASSSWKHDSARHIFRGLTASS